MEGHDDVVGKTTAVVEKVDLTVLEPREPPPKVPIQRTFCPSASNVSASDVTGFVGRPFAIAQVSNALPEARQAAVGPDPEVVARGKESQDAVAREPSAVVQLFRRLSARRASPPSVPIQRASPDARGTGASAFTDASGTRKRGPAR